VKVSSRASPSRTPHSRCDAPRVLVSRWPASVSGAEQALLPAFELRRGYPVTRGSPMSEAFYATIRRKRQALPLSIKNAGLINLDKTLFSFFADYTRRQYRVKASKSHPTTLPGLALRWGRGQAF
jgi:hypothetical protein